VGIQQELEGVVVAATRCKPTDLDCESAALLRASIRPIFNNATDWGMLSEILREKGYALRFREGQMCITDLQTDQRVCGLRFLGFEFQDLVHRMGRPVVVARGRDADGDLLTARPVSG